MSEQHEEKIQPRTRSERSAFTTGYAQCLSDITNHGTKNAAEFLATIASDPDFVSPAETFPANWARLLIERDSVWGPKVLDCMVKWFEEHDGKADDFGRLYIVTDAQKALDHAARMNQE
jgi:hypothetical protein